MTPPIRYDISPEQQLPSARPAQEDPDFERPYLDIDEWRDAPVRHRYVHGGFDTTETRFSFYFPAAEQYEGRFFQHVTPVPQHEHLFHDDPETIAFAVSIGAYAVETNGGGDGFTDPTADPTVYAYRANAATAQFSKQIARAVYGDHRVHGYLYGGSGGAFRTMGSAENTSGVWDGFVPFVPGSPMALPNVFSVRMHAQRVLQHKLDGIVDALEPGGSGDPYADLTGEEAAALTEATRMGFPLASWYAHHTMGTQSFSAIFPILQAVDPTYFDDFWTVAGYLGSDPTSSVHAARVVHRTTIAATSGEDDPDVALMMAPQHHRSGGVNQSWHGSGEASIAALRLAAPLEVDAQAAELHVRTGAATGARLMLRCVQGDLAVFDQGNQPQVLDQLAPGDEVEIDNSNVLAAQTYHRHQVPTGDDYPTWDQFRDTEGQPLHPQRPLVVGPMMAAGATGKALTGRYEGKMIAVSCLLDREAFPWQADWYRSRVVEHRSEGVDQHHRLWYIENGVHGDADLQDDPLHTVSYVGVLHQALRDLAAWVEHDVEPPASTRYAVLDGQVLVPVDATARRGVQPTLRLTVDGGPSTWVQAGDEVTLQVTAQVPDATGGLIGLEWDLDGSGAFAAADVIDPAATLAMSRRHTFEQAGTHFVTARVTAQRQGDHCSAHARILNLARVRVVVAG